MNDIVITYLASVLPWLMFAGLVFLWMWDGKINKEVAMHAFASSAFAWVIARMLKSLIPTTRPYGLNGESPLTLIIPSGGSFPSSHTAIVFALAVTIYLHNKKLGVLFLVIALVVGVGRVLAKVHFPVDIVGGAILGMLSALFVKRIHLRT